MYVSQLNQYLVNIKKNLSTLVFYLIIINIFFYVIGSQYFSYLFYFLQLTIQLITFKLIIFLAFKFKDKLNISIYFIFLSIYTLILSISNLVIQNNLLFFLFFINFITIISISIYMNNLMLNTDQKKFDYIFLFIFSIVLISFLYPLFAGSYGINHGNLSLFYLDSPNKSGITLFFANIFFFYFIAKYSNNYHFLILSLALFSLLSFLTLSRTHFFAFSFSTLPLIFYIIKKNNLKNILYLILLIFSMTFFIIIFLYNNSFNSEFSKKYFLNIVDMIISGRLITWLDKFILVINSNFFGCGIGCHNINNNTLSNAFDNQYLKSIYEIGLIGFLFFYLFVFNYFLKFKNIFTYSIFIYFIISGIGYEIYNLNLSAILFYFFIPYFFLFFKSNNSLKST